MVPDARVGDYLVLHAGFAITIISAEEAEKTYQMLEEIENGKEIKSIFG
ncbi:MAG TPA: HypC/HybG/HupF family hydrogenase formation chaperone [Candidatus Wallbacteria bacterium]|nr:HypC/HybG/HupF family hydrogenase formation chaperone [Candidatus Wallbacteria bacterium]